MRIVKFNGDAIGDVNKGYDLECYRQIPDKEEFPTRSCTSNCAAFSLRPSTIAQSSATIEKYGPLDHVAECWGRPIGLLSTKP